MFDIMLCGMPWQYTNTVHNAADSQSASVNSS